MRKADLSVYSSATMTRRAYLIMKATLDTGCTIFEALEAVSTTAIEHPEWDMNEERTWAEWDAPD